MERDFKGVTAPFFALHCVLPIVVGGLIYLAWRSEHLLMFDWAASIGLTGAIATLRDWAMPARAYVPGWVLFSVPDGVWVYACTAFFTRLWPDGPWPVRFGWIGIGAGLAIGGELGQIVGLVPGTFDVVDVLFYAVAAAGAFALSTEVALIPSRRARTTST